MYQPNFEAFFTKRGYIVGDVTSTGSGVVIYIDKPEEADAFYRTIAQSKYTPIEFRLYETPVIAETAPVISDKGVSGSEIAVPTITMIPTEHGLFGRLVRLPAKCVRSVIGIIKR